ncbi:MAG TPA: hypothetical protein VFZ53_26050, partial [Polyangiaceae bacterium]
MQPVRSLGICCFLAGFAPACDESKAAPAAAVVVGPAAPPRPSAPPPEKTERDRVALDGMTRAGTPPG